jgi:hypothetical protein
MKRSYCVTVVTEIDFVSAANDDVMERHLDDIVDAVRAAAESVSTRVTAAVHVTYCGGGVIASPEAALPQPSEESAPASEA